MIGKLLSDGIKIVTLPIDICESAADVFMGGDGSKHSKKTGFNPLSEIRDGICEGLEDSEI